MALWNTALGSLVEVDWRFIVLMKEAVDTSETSVYSNETTQRYIPPSYSTPWEPKNSKFDELIQWCSINIITDIDMKLRVDWAGSVA
jgi:hypothetical protein